jgi:hypothetical protein
MSNYIKLTEQVVLKMPTTWGDRLMRVQSIQAILTNNTYIPNGWTILGLTQTQFDVDVATFIAAVTAVKDKTFEGVTLRNAAFKTLKQDLGYIMSMVQSIADANPAIATVVIEACGFFVKPTHGRPARQNAAFNTQIPGTIMLTADGAGPHEWQMSKDMVDITTMPPTTTSKTIVEELNPGDVLYFRNKKFDTKARTYNWSSWQRLMVGPGGVHKGSSGTTGSAGNLTA